MNIIRNKLNLSICLPGSKSITLRNLVLATLAEGITDISAPADCDDTREMVDCLRALGVSIKTSDEYRQISVAGTGGRFSKGPVTLSLGLSGTSARFLIALSTLRNQVTQLVGRGSLNQRPNHHLLDAVEQLGGETVSVGNGSLPVAIKGPSTFAKIIKMNGDVSSQYFSALLQIAPLLPNGLEIIVRGVLVSRPYVDITINEMRKFGVEIENEKYQRFIIEPQKYRAGLRTVEGDASAASYFAALALIHGGKVTLENLSRDTTCQGDIRFLSICEKLGATIKLEEGRTIVEGPKDGHILPVNGELNCCDIPDSALTLIAIAPLIPGTTRITGLGTLKHKECDRIEAPAAELRKIGVDVVTGPDFIEVSNVKADRTHKPQNIDIKTYDDHRMAMSFAVLATRIGDLSILEPDVVRKTYPSFWKDLAKIK